MQRIYDWWVQFYVNSTTGEKKKKTRILNKNLISTSSQQVLKFVHAIKVTFTFFSIKWYCQSVKNMYCVFVQLKHLKYFLVDVLYLFGIIPYFFFLKMTMRPYFFLVFIKQWLFISNSFLFWIAQKLWCRDGSMWAKL